MNIGTDWGKKKPRIALGGREFISNGRAIAGPRRVDAGVDLLWAAGGAESV